MAPEYSIVVFLRPVAHSTYSIREDSALQLRAAATEGPPALQQAIHLLYAVTLTEPQRVQHMLASRPNRNVGSHVLLARSRDCAQQTHDQERSSWDVT